jgi:hypothetical protein
MNNNVLAVIARHADIDTRRAMGFLPRKLDLTPWRDFQPKGFIGELFRYFVNEKRLEYLEIWEYDCIFHEVITDVHQNAFDSDMWVTLSDSIVRGVFQGHNRTNVYAMKKNNEMFYTAGRPVFVT